MNPTPQRRPKLGRKAPKTDAPTVPDLLEPHILRALANVRVASVHASCAGCHFACLDVDGAAWLFGRNTGGALGTKGESVSENEPRRVGAEELGAEEGVRIVWAACGRAHTLLVGSDGTVWSAGANSVGQVSWWLFFRGIPVYRTRWNARRADRRVLTSVVTRRAPKSARSRPSRPPPWVT